MTASRYKQIMKTFGTRLRKAREAAGYDSAQKFAGILGKEPHTYRHYERGEAEPDYDTLTTICQLLKVTPGYLLPEAEAAGKGKGSSSSSSGQTAA